MHCLYGGYNLHRFSDALGLVVIWYYEVFITTKCSFSLKNQPVVILSLTVNVYVIFRNNYCLIYRIFYLSLISQFLNQITVLQFHVPNEKIL